MKRTKQNIREERERGGEERIKGKTERRSEGERERGRREGWGERKQKTWEGERGEKGVGERKERPESGVHERFISVSSGKSLPHMSVLIHKPMVRHQQQQMILRRGITSPLHPSGIHLIPCGVIETFGIAKIPWDRFYLRVSRNACFAAALQLSVANSPPQNCAHAINSRSNQQ